MTTVSEMSVSEILAKIERYSSAPLASLGPKDMAEWSFWRQELNRVPDRPVDPIALTADEVAAREQPVDVARLDAAAAAFWRRRFRDLVSRDEEPQFPDPLLQLQR